MSDSDTMTRRWILGRTVTLASDEVPGDPGVMIRLHDPAGAAVDGDTVTLLFEKFGWAVFRPSFRRAVMGWALSIGGGISVMLTVSILAHIFDSGPGTIATTFGVALVVVVGTGANLFLYYQPRRITIAHSPDMAAVFRYLVTVEGTGSWGDPVQLSNAWRFWLDAYAARNLLSWSQEEGIDPGAVTDHTVTKLLNAARESATATLTTGTAPRPDDKDEE